jgi:hypothetical protein
MAIDELDLERHLPESRSSDVVGHHGRPREAQPIEKLEHPARLADPA